MVISKSKSGVYQPNNKAKHAYNNFVVADCELHPLERTPHTNEESEDAKVHTTKKNMAVHRRI